MTKNLQTQRPEMVLVTPEIEAAIYAAIFHATDVVMNYSNEMRFATQQAADAYAQMCVTVVELNNACASASDGSHTSSMQ